jgi:hypothetical protein
MELTRQISPVAAPESLWDSIQSPARAQAAERGAKPMRNASSADARSVSVVREFLQSAQAAERGYKGSETFPRQPRGACPLCAHSLESRHARAGAGARAWLLWPVAALIVLLASGGARLRDSAQMTPDELRGLASSAKACDLWSDDPVEIRNWVKSRGDIDVDLPASRSGAVRLVGARLVQVRGTLVAAIAYKSGTGAGALVVSNRRPASTAPVARHAFLRTGLFSWSMNGQAYQIAQDGDARGACLLCHLD